MLKLKGISGICSSNGKNEKYIHSFSSKIWREERILKTRLRLEGDAEMVRKERNLEEVNWSTLVPDADLALTFQAPEKENNFLIGRKLSASEKERYASQNAG